MTALEPLPTPHARSRVNFAYGQTLRRVGKRRDADTVLRREPWAKTGTPS
ncbi:hypothetical protein [Streptomyces sp. NPDC058247]